MQRQKRKGKPSEVETSLMRRHWKACRDFCMYSRRSLLIFFLVSIFKLAFEDARPMEWMRQQAFLALHHWLIVDPRGDLPVVIVDISHLKTQSPTHGTTNNS